MTPGQLRIAYVSLHTSPTDLPGTGDAGGMNVVELNQALALGRRGHHVDLITRRADSKAYRESSIGKGVRLVLLDAGPPEPMAKSAQEAVIGDFARELAALAPYDVVVSQHWMSGVAALPVARAWGVPHVQSFHSIAADDGADLSEGEPAESPGRPRGERDIAQHSDAVIAISQAERNTAISRLGADSKRVHVVLPGVDLETFRPAVTRTHPPYLAYAARLQPLKAPDLAVRSLAAIEPAARPDLHIAGEVSQDFTHYRAELDALIDELGVRDHVRFVGSFDRRGLADFFARATLTLVPSYSETFGLVALESAACGTPVIATAAGGLLESVRSGESGVLISERSPRRWASEIERLLSDRSAYDVLVAGALRHASRFDWDRSAEGVEDVLRTVIEARAAVSV